MQQVMEWKMIDENNRKKAICTNQQKQVSHIFIKIKIKKLVR